MDSIINYCIEYVNSPYYWVELVLGAICIIYWMYILYLRAD